MDLRDFIKENPSISTLVLFVILGIVAGIAIVMSADILIYAAGILFVIGGIYILSVLKDKTYKKINNIILVKQKMFIPLTDIYVDSFGNLYKGNYSDILVNSQKYLLNLKYQDLPSIFMKNRDRFYEYKLIQEVDGGYLPYDIAPNTEATLFIEKINEAYINNLSKISTLLNEQNNKMFMQQNLGFFLILTVGSIVLLIASTYLNSQTTNQLNSLLAKQEIMYKAVLEFVCVEKNHSYSFCEMNKKNESKNEVQPTIPISLPGVSG